VNTAKEFIDLSFVLRGFDELLSLTCHPVKEAGKPDE
jgi:hypothetical protein